MPSPLLFDLIDEAGDGRPPACPRRFWKVVDQCYLCDVCYMTKCPYVPPHQWNLDFPHTMLRAKAIQYKTGKMKFRDKLLTSTELVGTLSSIPVVAQAVNAANKFGPARAVLQQALGVDARRQLPEFDSANFRAEATASHNHPVRDGAKSPGKVAVFSTCYVNYNEPGIGHDLLKLLDHNEIPYRRGAGRNLLRHAQAGTGRPRHRREVQGAQHPADASTGNRPATPSSRRCRPAR
jgi:glycerol-3-phosphate dehydrogenase subunit C